MGKLKRQTDMSGLFGGYYVGQREQFDFLIIGSDEAGKNLACTMAEAGRRTAVVERKLIGGSCPNIACLPSKNVQGAKVADLARHGSSPVLNLLIGVLLPLRIELDLRNYPLARESMRVEKYGAGMVLVRRSVAERMENC